MQCLTTLALCLLSCLAFPSCATQVQAEDSTPPNIILFLVDDMGWQDTSVQFAEEPSAWNARYKTPNMQRLADQGMRFTNAYAACTVCSPTRCALITGQNPARTGITDWVGHGRSANDILQSPEWTANGLQPGDGNLTLPAILSDAGFLTAHIGKAHFGSGQGADPLNLGFDINIGGSHVGSPCGQGEQGAYFGPFPQNVHPNMQDYPEGTYITEALTIEANKVIDRAIKEDKPFFINLAHYAVHAPIRGQGDPRFIEDFDGPPSERDYAAMVASMDASLGAVMDHLEDRGIAENTIIFFLSDNGGLSNHSRANTDDADDPYGLNWHNAPAFSGKGAAYEGGTRVPMIVAWAAGEDQWRVFSPGRECALPTVTQDVFPTILALAQVENPVELENRDGITLFNLWINEGFDIDPRSNGLFWHYPHQWYNAPQATRQAGIRPYSAVRFGDLKLLYFYTPTGGELELFDLSQDIVERSDLATNPEYRDDLQRLTLLMLDWFERTDAALPIDKATGETVDISILIDAAGR